MGTDIGYRDMSVPNIVRHTSHFATLRESVKQQPSLLIGWLAQTSGATSGHILFELLAQVSGNLDHLKLSNRHLFHIHISVFHVVELIYQQLVSK